MTNQDEEKIYEADKAFAVAWNNGDAKLAASFFTEDAVRVGAFGDVQHGRHEIEDAYDKLLHQSLPGAKVNMEKGEIRFLTPEIAVLRSGIEIKPAGGINSMKGYAVSIFKKENGRWLIVEAHPKLFPTHLK